jgi:predicted esterase YcpF (UPF0227 family)
MAAPGDSMDALHQLGRSHVTGKHSMCAGAQHAQTERRLFGVHLGNYFSVWMGIQYPLQILGVLVNQRIVQQHNGRFQFCDQWQELM